MFKYLWLVVLAILYLYKWVCVIVDIYRTVKYCLEKEEPFYDWWLALEDFSISWFIWHAIGIVVFSFGWWIVSLIK